MTFIPGRGRPPQKPEDNPDVAELIRYNRAGCSHANVPGALTETQADAQREALGLRAFAEKFQPMYCAGCLDFVAVAR